MCGIIGYIGNGKAAPVLTGGLRRMEYRGYDSAGIAVIQEGHLKTIKRQGKVEELAKAVNDADFHGPVGIGHTRWATHGVPSEANAHPHMAGRVAIVHNGIIENFSELKSKLTSEGVEFKSQTDSEVLAHMISAYVQEGCDLPQAVQKTVQQVVGTFGLAVIERDRPDVIVAARRGSPLLIGVGNNEMFIASDATAIVGHTNKVVYLEDDEIAICRPDGYQVKDMENRERMRVAQTIALEVGSIEKAGYDHFLLKEIMEQPKSVGDLLRGRLDSENGTSHLGGLNVHDDFLRGQKRFLTIGCGTAYYAGLLGKYLLERMTKIPVDVEFGSEFRYRAPVLADGTLAVIITQSGETADTMASLRELKRQGVPTMGLVNVVGSSVAREVDGGMYLHAGPEISVASTKAFTSQVAAQLLLGLQIARLKGLSITEGRSIIAALEDLPKKIEQTLKLAPEIKKLAKKYAHFNNAMYLGRDTLYPVALEGSHKIKEVSYIHAEAYPAGEMKHGANALIDENLLVVFLVPKNALYSKAKSNLEEVRARSGRVLAIATEGDKEIAKEADDVIYIPEASEWIEPIIANIPLQLFAYYFAVERGTDVDQPRNLAKSVTVE
ncbi:MAG TPA: glutamine--fructose-6-phosphate transaminase (isomerizing) [Candidatus Dormibacteraeota bacterium]|nr:glutamine--fructose-6-phosphate transaminase (isomerizing) [Candidatus Dormibacteraeota bacterium]